MAGCTTSNPAKSSAQAAPLKVKADTLPNLTKYSLATVKPFDTSKSKNTDRSVGVEFAEAIARRLKHDFGTLFDQVNVGDPTGTAQELIITGDITKYAPGDKFLRGMLIGLGAARFNGNLCLRDADQQLLFVPFEKLWAWGGVLGMSKGIEDMESETAASIANTVARQKGWSPPPAK